MADHPWHKPDPKLPAGYVPPAGYWPPPPYGAPRYDLAPGVDPNNPYAAPPPFKKKRSRMSFLITIGIVELLLLGGKGVAIYYLTSGKSTADHANAFLHTVREQKFDAAYDQLCDGVKANEPRVDFVEGLQEAASRGHKVSSYFTHSVRIDTGLGELLPAATGRVEFADGYSRSITVVISKEEGKSCIGSGFEDLV